MRPLALATMSASIPPAIKSSAPGVGKWGIRCGKNGSGGLSSQPGGGPSSNSVLSGWSCELCTPSPSDGRVASSSASPCSFKCRFRCSIRLWRSCCRRSCSVCHCCCHSLSFTPGGTGICLGAKGLLSCTKYRRTNSLLEFSDRPSWLTPCRCPASGETDSFKSSSSSGSGTVPLAAPNVARSDGLFGSSLSSESEGKSDRFT
mmetsp:Transcript_43047/g.77442  ORF Transcript_43047/g.77442 Transcript_43047/m.77442 type:complete len:203 (+) Transcript_43047:700-1308(+)